MAIGPDGKVMALITIDDPETQDRMGDRFLSDVGLYAISDEGESEPLYTDCSIKAKNPFGEN